MNIIPYLGFGVPYLNTFFFKEPEWNKSVYFFLPGYLKAQLRFLLQVYYGIPQNFILTNPKP